MLEVSSGHSSRANELRKIGEDSANNEGLNIKLFPIRCTKSNLSINNNFKKVTKKGYESMLEYYLKVAPQFNEPLYARPARTVV